MRIIEVCEKCDSFRACGLGGLYYTCNCEHDGEPTFLEPYFDTDYYLRNEFEGQDIPKKCLFRFEHIVLIQTVSGIA